MADALWECDGASKQHDVSVTGQPTQVAEKLQEHLQLAALDDGHPRQHTTLIVRQHVTLTLCDVRAGTCYKEK